MTERKPDWKWTHAEHWRHRLDTLFATVPALVASSDTKFIRVKLLVSHAEKASPARQRLAELSFVTLGCALARGDYAVTVNDFVQELFEAKRWDDAASSVAERHESQREDLQWNVPLPAERMTYLLHFHPVTKETAARAMTSMTKVRYLSRFRVQWVETEEEMLVPLLECVEAYASLVADFLCDPATHIDRVFADCKMLRVGTVSKARPKARKAPPTSGWTPAQVDFYQSLVALSRMSAATAMQLTEKFSSWKGLRGASEKELAAFKRGSMTRALGPALAKRLRALA